MRAQKTDSVIAELQKRMREPPPAPRTIDPTIPVALEQIVMPLHPDGCGRAVRDAQDLLAELDKLDAKGVPLPLVRAAHLEDGDGAAAVLVAVLLVTAPTGRRGDRRRRSSTSRSRS